MRKRTHVTKRDALGPSRQRPLPLEHKLALSLTTPFGVRPNLVLESFGIMTALAAAEANEKEVGEAVAVEVDKGVEVRRGEVAGELARGVGGIVQRGVDPGGRGLNKIRGVFQSLALFFFCGPAFVGLCPR